MSRKTVITCDICGVDLGTEEGVFTTGDGKDICTECMERLVNEYFARGTIIPQKEETIKMVPIDRIVSRNAEPESEQTASEKYDSIMKKIREEEKAEQEAKYEEILESASAGSKKKKGTEERKKAPEPTPEDSRLFDQGKAQALRNAGWSIKKIAEEMRCCPATVYNNTYQPVEKKKRDLEFVDDDIARLGQTDTYGIKEAMEG